MENDEWIDDDLEVAVYSASSGGLSSSDNHVKVIQEAEALEREQIRIEQEIQRLKGGSVFYLREIPNKPPPPYTPPGQALNWQQPSKSHPSGIRNPESQWLVPRSKDQVSRYCRRFAQHIIEQVEFDQPPEIPEHLFDVVDITGSDNPELRNSCRAFMSLLLDLVTGFVHQLKPRASFLPHFYNPRSI